MGSDGDQAGVLQESGEKFLPRLIHAFESIKLNAEDGETHRIDTASFAAACVPILDAFHLLGSVFSWAKSDFEQKRKSVEHAATEFPSLEEIIEDGRKNNTIGVKNSNARNLHRLKCGVHFIVALLEKLCSSRNVTMREAASEAYTKALQPIHNWAVQAAVQASLLACPTREFFLENIKETDESAKALAEKFAQAADPVVTAVEALFGSDIPPPSGTWGSGGSWWGGSS